MKTNLLIPAFLLFIVFPAFTQSSGVPVVFVVDDFATHKEIAGAMVYVRQVASTKQTGTNGKVSFETVPVGEIEYNIMKEGYQFETGRVNVSTDVRTNSFRISLSIVDKNKILVTGEVTDAEGHDVKDALVEVKIADVTRTVLTDESGNYSLDIAPNPSFPSTQIRIEVKKGNCKVNDVIEMNRSNIVYKDFKLDCSQATNGQAQGPGPSSYNGPLAEKTSDGIKFTVERFEQRGGTATFFFKLENMIATNSVRDFWFHYSLNELINQDGLSFESNRVGIGNVESSDSYTEIKLIYATPVRGFIEFEVGQVIIKRAALLKVGTPNGNVEFTNVIIKK